MKYIDIVFDGPPSHESGRFVEVEDETGKSINFGEWLKRPDGYWALRIPPVFELQSEMDRLREELKMQERISDHLQETIDRMER